MRRAFLASCSIAVLMTVCWGFLSPLASTRQGVARAAAPTLQETLINGLLARTKGERDFMRHIADLVNKKKLSRKTVMELFHYVRTRHPFHKAKARIFAIKLQQRVGRNLTPPKNKKN